jgi:hypothetical protein
MIQLNYCNVIEKRIDGSRDAKRGIEIEIWH